MATNPRIDDLKKRLQKEPGSRLFAQLAEELRKAGDLDDAIAVSLDGLQKHSNYPSARMTLGRCYFDKKDLQGARREFEVVLKSAPDNILASRLLAESLEGLGENESAVRQYRAALALSPGDAHLAARLGEVEGRRGQPARPPAPPAEVTPEVEVEPPPIPLASVESESFELDQPFAAPIVVASESNDSSTTAAFKPVPETPLEAAVEIVPEPASLAADVSPFEVGAQPAAEMLVEPEGQLTAQAPIEAEAPAFSTPPGAEAQVSAPLTDLDSALEGQTTSATPGSADWDVVLPPVGLPDFLDLEPPAAGTVASDRAPSPVREGLSFEEASSPASPMPYDFEVPASVIPEPVKEEPRPGAGLGAPVAKAARTFEDEPPPPWAEPARGAGPDPEPSEHGEIISSTLAELYFNQGFTDKAVEVYKQVVSREPGNERAKARLAELESPAHPLESRPAAEALPEAPRDDAARARRREALQRTILRLEGMLLAFRKD